VDLELLRNGRVAHLATADAAGRPHVVPVCFVFVGGADDSVIYIALDEKPKRRSPLGLKRVRNIRENDHVALVVDHYEENWARLRYALVFGRASLLRDDTEHLNAVSELRSKYPQYRDMALDTHPVIKVRVQRIVGWPAPERI
jgi:PPOX class probable F420-dependent enzyme